MTGIATPFHQNFASDKKNTDVIEKDIKKWVDSVVEFKASMEKQKKDVPTDKNIKNTKKPKMKKKTNASPMPTTIVKSTANSQHKTTKTKKVGKKSAQALNSEKPRKKESEDGDVFDTMKESFRSLKLPPNWTSGLSSNRIVFNRVKVITQNAQQKLAVEKSLIITKDLNVHVLLNGSEINVSNWETQKVNTVDDLKKAIKDIDSLKMCDGQSNEEKNPNCSILVDSNMKMCEACQSETKNPPKPLTKKSKTTKKTGGTKAVTKH